MKMYFAADNRYGNETGIGFANSWYVMAFASKETRDEFVSVSNSMAARPISADEVTRYASMNSDFSTPKPFSGEFWAIWDDRITELDGYIGTVVIANEGGHYGMPIVRRLYTR